MTVDELEHTIHTALLKFVNATGQEIESIHVDTRNFANYNVEVFLREEKRRGAQGHPVEIPTNSDKRQHAALMTAPQSWRGRSCPSGR